MKFYEGQTPRARYFRLRVLFLFLLLLLAGAAAVHLLCTALPPPAAFAIYLDAGHGGFDPGAVAVGKGGEEIYEKDIALAYANALGTCLAEAGYPVTYSRHGDERLTYTTSRDELIARRAAAREVGCELLLSLHANSWAGEGRAYGPRVYYNPETEGAYEMAEALAKSLSAHTLPTIGAKCRAVADPSLYLLADTALPALLVEVGFLSDSEECAALCRTEYREGFCRALSEGVDTCRHLMAKK